MSSTAWKRYNIFLSSTFKDMDFERDVIKFRVIPALNRRFRDRRIELQAIDLRLGVNTEKMSEEQSERKVLSVCTSCIDSARPFFIGLIGQRYGWVPPVERWKEFMAGLSDEERSILKDTAGCSVTEMEIVYGALSQGSFDSSHVLFYLRDESSYEAIPEEMKSVFCDTDADSRRKLETLKAKVQKLFGERGGQDDRCTPYHLEWADGHFSSDSFERIVTEQLAQQIEAETAKEEKAGSDSWWAQEKELEESTLLRLIPGSIDLDIFNQEDEESEEDEEDESSDIALWYVQGFGASTYMAREYIQWDEDSDVVRLLGVFGLSEFSTSMRPVLVRWIHELAAFIGREDLPEDGQLLGRMPEPELNALFAELIDAVAEENYIYIYLDDVEALETTSAKDLYMPWLDRVKDKVNILVNLQDESEAREKFLSAHPYLARKMALGVQGDADAAEALIDNYEKLYFLELPKGMRREMIKIAAKGNKTVSPLKIHSIFRIFESLNQEDFAQIRGSSGSQIDAINGYLENIWKEMPESSYDIMTFMVNQIVANLCLGEQMRQAIWTIAAAPGGLRECDIAHFAGEDWDSVQFYRAMNFLHDFFYEDRGRHVWRAKYITLPEDGLARRQKAISEYIIGLDKEDSLRETMGLYYALGGCEPSHFAHYMVEGDYLHGQQMAWLTKTYGPQMRQLAREGFFESEDFSIYSKALEVPQRLQLFMDIMTALADLYEERMKIAKRLAGLLDDVDVDALSAPDAFAYASTVVCDNESETALLKAMKAARRCKALGFETAGQLVSMAGTLLYTAYMKKGDTAKADELKKELDAGDARSASERFTALTPLLAQAHKDPSLVDRFFREYYAIVDSLEVNESNFTARFKSARLMLFAYDILLSNKEYGRLLDELIRFIPSMQLFYRAGNFFSYPEALSLHMQYHIAFISATQRLEQYKLLFDVGTPLSKIGCLAYLACTEAGLRLKELDPDGQLMSQLRQGFAGNTQEDVDMLRESLGLQGVPLKDIDDYINEQYNEYRNSL